MCGLHGIQSDIFEQNHDISSVINKGDREWKWMSSLLLASMEFMSMIWASIICIELGYEVTRQKCQRVHIFCCCARDLKHKFQDSTKSFKRIMWNIEFTAFFRCKLSLLTSSKFLLSEWHCCRHNFFRMGLNFFSHSSFGRHYSAAFFLLWIITPRWYCCNYNGHPNVKTRFKCCSLVVGYAKSMNY